MKERQLTTLIIRRYQTLQFLSIAMMLTFVARPAEAQWIVAPTPANQVSVTVTPTVSFDASTGLYTYSYNVASRSTSVQNVWRFAIRTTSPGTLLTPPSGGWSSREYSQRPLVSWAATETGPPPPDWVDDGGLPPNPIAIHPGNSVSGFRLVSPDPPGTVTYYAQGEVPIPVAKEDADVVVPDQDITVDSVSGQTVGPVPVVAPDFFEGGRRPAVDAFLVFIDLVDGGVRTNPTSIMIKFAARGESVDRSTFRAELNGVDVTAAFVAVSAPGDLAALFAVGSSPLKIGKNVLLTSVSGTVPGTQRIARDTDRVTFTVQ